MVDGAMEENLWRKTFLSQRHTKCGRCQESCRYGVDGIVVSNYAGRQVDGAIASLDALEEIVDAVGNKIYVSWLPNTSSVEMDRQDIR